MTIPMIGNDEPSFIQGTFSWSERGYHWASPPPIDLLDESSLRHADPWICIASHLEHTKAGHAPPLGPLIRFTTAQYAPAIISACLDLLADAGTEEDALLLVDVMHDESRASYDRLAAASACVHTGFTWAADALLELWRGCKIRDRGAVSFLLSELLEEELEDEEVPVATFEGFDSDDEYVEFVKERLESLRATLPSTSAPIYHGREFEVIGFARYFQKRLEAPDADPPTWAGFHNFRRRFEATTGLDCTQFYVDGDFKPLSARVVVDEFLESANGWQFTPGRRYFWGRAIEG